MAAEMLGDYARGKELIEAEDFEAGIDLWHTVAGTAEDQVADRHLRCWLLLRIGISWAQARQWEQAQRVYRSALEAAQDHLAKVVIWQAIGDAYKKVSKFEAARRAYGSAQEIQTTKLGESLTFARGLHYQGELNRSRAGSIRHRCIGSALLRFGKSWRPAVSTWQRA